MNEKSSVSKELNARHAKILEGLLKLPKNRECADCQSKAPRWASINLGIFICMQCSGTHRSLGVHISKVRSTTLDTWLPEQVSFMQMMGNEISNDYWEAELPPVFDRNPIDKFINAKYVEKRWASRTSKEPGLLVSQNKPIGTSRRDIPKKARKYSLDEESLAMDLPQVIPFHITRNRGASLDLMTDTMPDPSNVVTAEITTTRKSVDAATDLFSLLYVSEEKQDRTVVPPSRWATFESDHASNREDYVLCLHKSSLEYTNLLFMRKIYFCDGWDLTEKDLINPSNKVCFVGYIRPYDAITGLPLSSNLRRPQLDKPLSPKSASSSKPRVGEDF